MEFEIRKLWPTFEILGSENNRSQAIVCDERADLRRDFFSFPAHHEELAHGPETMSMHSSSRCREVLTGPYYPILGPNHRGNPPF
jgi:hypothetical protein